MPSGYYRFPTIAADNIVFACEDDLWTVSASGGIARRLTSNLGETTRPMLSPDSTQLAFVGYEEGQPEIYLMPAQGGQAKRLTFMGGSLCQTVGWRDGKIILANNAGQPFAALLHLYMVDTDGNLPESINLGPARTISFGPNGGAVIGRNTADPARWKRYRGGTAGQIWIDETGSGEFHALINLASNLTAPMWIGKRIYFISDHEGIGNLYSCLPNGKDLRRHTEHAGLYARNAATDGKRIVYHAGADLYLFDPVSNSNALIPIEFHSPQTQRNRKFVSATKYLEDAALHPQGQHVAVSTRGKVFTMANWEGAVFQPGDVAGIRFRLPNWLNDGERIVAVTDADGEELFVILRADASQEPIRLDGLDVGRPLEVAVNPKKDQIAFSNHRQQLMMLDLETRELKLIDRGVSHPISGFDWSPDGAWLAYSVSTSLQVDVLKLWRAETAESIEITQPVLRDVAPAFDPQGKYLYFLSYRHFDPVYDNLHFDMNFPRGMKPFLITLQKDLPSPFIPKPKVDEKKSEEKEKAKSNEKEKEKDEPKPLQIDLDGITSRIVAFPVDEGLFGRIRGLKDGKVTYSCFPVEGTLDSDWAKIEPPSKGSLMVYTFDDQREEEIVSGISDFDVSRDVSMLMYRSGNRLRVIKAGDKIDSSGSSPSRKTGWLDLGRINLAVNPGDEWRQMFREAWRLQRDHFWTPDMSKIDWLAVYERYLPLVDRVASRSEFSDLMWEMQGELGTSHAYELGGDYRRSPDYSLGFLGAEFGYDAATESWKITRIAQGDHWDEEHDSPLNGAGINVQVGDRIIAINGRKLNRALSPAMALVNLAREQVALMVQHGDEPARIVTIKALHNDTPTHYREWVERNRQRVHAATNGRVGYVHIPDMGSHGYAEFHRGYLAEVDREGLIVDVRFNGGGNVSPLILEKLARRRLAYEQSRWGQMVAPYPPQSILGPMVALTNEQAGSDGDIFSHGFKLMQLGPLLGKRTWGGVIGIWPRHTLVDGTITTQPEFSFWFKDVGWGVENYGTDPDIEVDNTPQDYARGYDAQLERAIEEILRLLEANPPKLPTFGDRPSRALPKLP
ncbi:MAG: PDZ domain-containing protein [Chloroflexi bacterium]|nr:PDZ domain-containing protein [Chloroflexota bacterium]